MKNFVIEYDGNRQNSGAYPQSDVIYNVALTSGAMKTVARPAGAIIVVFSKSSPTGNFYCRFDGTVTVPSGDIIDGSAGEVNPIIRSLVGASTINLISDANMNITLAFYTTPRVSSIG